MAFNQALYSSFLVELQKIAASKHRLNISKARSGRRSLSVHTLLKKDKEGTLFKKHSSAGLTELESHMKPGDIVLTRAVKPTLMSRLVSAVQGSEFGHSSIYVGEGKVVDTRVSEGVFETPLSEVHSKWGGGRDLRVYRPDVSTAERKRAIETARGYIGTPYDRLGALRLILPAGENKGAKPGKKDALICSQLITQAYPALNVAKAKNRDHVLPADIAKSPLTKLVGELSTEKQAAGGSEPEYRLQGHTTHQGLSLAIENAKGSVRKGVDPDGKKWRTVFKHPYGYIKNTEGKDGEEIDAYVGPNASAPNAFVVHQRLLSGRGHDEDKIMLGFDSKAHARSAYLEHYNKVGPKLLGPISTITVDELKRRLAEKRKHTKLAMSSSPVDLAVKTTTAKSGDAPSRDGTTPGEDGAKTEDGRSAVTTIDNAGTTRL